MEPSHNLLVLANDNKGNVEQTLKIPLEDSKRLIEDIEKTNEDTVSNLRDINREDINDAFKCMIVKINLKVNYVPFASIMNIGS